MKLNIIRAILILLLLGTFNIIFGFSSQNAKESSGISKRISESIINITSSTDSKEIKESKVRYIEPIIRKLAHFSIYTLVGLLLMALISTYNLNLKKKIIISLTIGFLYACSDEIHQLFVSGRSGEVRDVLIDSSGVLVGILICLGIIKMYKKFYLKSKINC